MSEKENIDPTETILEKIKFKEDKFLNKEIVGQKIISQINIYKIKNRQHKLWFIRSVAAIVLVTLSIGAYFGSQVNITTSNNIAELNLRGNYNIEIKENSELTYNRLTWFLFHDVKLQGKANFNIETGNKFKVKTHLGNISVLGTEFMVNSNDSLLTVECYEGSVLVETTKGQVILTKSEKIIFNGSVIEKSTIWPEYIEFENSPLSDVFDKLEQIYGIEFIGWDKYRDVLFSGIISTQDIDEALIVLSNCCELEYNINDKDNNIDLSSR